MENLEWLIILIGSITLILVMLARDFVIPDINWCCIFHLGGLGIITTLTGIPGNGVHLIKCNDCGKIFIMNDREKTVFRYDNNSKMIEFIKRECGWPPEPVKGMPGSEGTWNENKGKKDVLNRK